MKTKAYAAIGFAALAFASAACGAVEIRFPAPKDAVISSVGEDMNLNGVNLSAWELRSDRSPDDVLAFYRERWAKGGPTGGAAYVEHKTGAWRVLTHIEDGDVYTVQVQPDASKKGTVGLLGISDLMSRKPTAARDLASDFPKPAGTTVQNDLVSQDLGVRSRTILLENPSTVKQNLNFYIRYFEKNGWAIESGTRIEDTNAGALIASRDGRRWQLTFTPGPKIATQMVAVLEER